MLKNLFKKISEMPLIQRISDELSEPLFSGGGLLPLLLVVACLSLNVSVRLFPAYLPDLKESAVLSLIGRYSAELSKKSAGDKDGKAHRVTEQVQELIGTDPQAFNRKFDLELAKLKDPFQDEHGLTYLMEFDPYTWARWTQNILRNGHPGDKIVKGKSYDSTMLAPLGCEVFYYRFLFYLSAFLYRMVNFFTAAFSVEQFLFFIPVFYAVCFLIVMYGFVRSRSNDLSAFLAVLLIGLTSEVLHRSSAGWYDFDALSLMMPVIVAGCFLRSLKKGARLRERISWACLAAFFEGVYSMTWPGWPVTLLIVAGFLLAVLPLSLFEGKKGSGKSRSALLDYLVSGGVFFAMTVVFGSLFIGDNFLKQFDWLAKYLKLGTSVHGGGLIWPSVLYTIIEMDSLSAASLIQQHLYGPLIFFAALLSIPIVVFREWRTERRDVTLLMLCWFCVMAVASLKGQRFVIFLSIPLFFFFALLLGEYLPDFIRKKWSGLKRIAGFSVYFLLAALLIQTVVKSGVAKAEMIRPVMNDSWHKALVFLDKNSPEDAIVNSWWDYGSWFRYYGNRRVIFDGTSNHPSLAYWMARVLLEKDEEKAIRVLRMLNNAGYNTWYLLEKKIKDPFLCGAVLEKLLNSSEDESRKILEVHGFSGEDSRGILATLYARPAPAYFVVEKSLLNKMGNISFLGHWDFQKLYARKNHKRSGSVVAGELEKIYGLSSEEAQKIVRKSGAAIKTREDNEALSQRYSFYTGVVNNAREGALVYFDYGLVFNPLSNDALLYSLENDQYKVPRKVILFEDGGFREIKKENGNESRTALLLRQGDTYKSFLADEALVRSLFVRLFLLGGNKSKYFEPFYSDEENGIYIYRIHWDAK